MPTASIYVRRSSKSGESTISLAIQELEVRKLLDRYGYTVTGVFKDDGISGAKSKDDRPGWRAFLQSLKMVDACGIYDISRATREGIQGIADLADALGRDESSSTGRVRLLTCDGVDTSDLTAYLRVAITGEISRSERDRITQRNRDRTARMKAEGMWLGGRVPFGMKRDLVGHRLEVDEDQAEILHSMARWIVAGASPREVALRLNGAGVQRNDGAAWTRVNVRKALESVQARQSVLTISEAQSVDDALQSGERHPKRARPRRFLLSGWARCASCGSPVMVVGGKKGARYYACSGKIVGSATCESPGRGRADVIDSYVESLYLQEIGDLPTMEVEPQVITGKVDELARSLADAEQRLAVTRDRVERHRLVDEIDELEQALELERAKPLEVQYIPTGETFREVWEKRQAPELRASILADACESVKISAGTTGARGDTHWDRVTVVWRHDTE